MTAMLVQIASSLQGWDAQLSAITFSKEFLGRVFHALFRSRDRSADKPFDMTPKVKGMISFPADTLYLAEESLAPAFSWCSIIRADIIPQTPTRSAEL